MLDAGAAAGRGDRRIDATAESPGVDVVLLNWRGADDTIECLESLVRQRYSPYRVVVCDNDSGDGSLDRIAQWASALPQPLRCVRYDRAEAEAGGRDEEDGAALVLIQTGGNLGFAGGNNVAIRYALRRADVRYLWLLNNDTVVDPEALASLVATAEADPGSAMVGSKLLECDDRDRIQTIAGGTVHAWRGLSHPIGAGELDAGQWEESFEPDFITGASLLVRIEAIREVGPMAEEYFLYSEEVDWCLRMRRGGWRLLYSPGSRVWHKGGRSVGHRSSMHDYYTVRSMLLLVWNFYPYWLPVTFVYSLGRCLAPKVVRRQPERFRAVIRAYRDFFLGRSPSPSEPTRAKS